MLQPLVLTIPWGVAWYISPATYDSRLFFCFRVADLTKKHHKKMGLGFQNPVGKFRLPSDKAWLHVTN